MKKERHTHHVRKRRHTHHSREGGGYTPIVGREAGIPHSREGGVYTTQGIPQGVQRVYHQGIPQGVQRVYNGGCTGVGMCRVYNGGCTGWYTGRHIHGKRLPRASLSWCFMPKEAPESLLFMVFYAGKRLPSASLSMGFIPKELPRASHTRVIASHTPC